MHLLKPDKYDVTSKYLFLKENNIKKRILLVVAHLL